MMIDGNAKAYQSRANAVLHVYTGRVQKLSDRDKRVSLQWMDLLYSLSSRGIKASKMPEL